MKILRVYPTRIEIEPYKAGEWEGIEKLCSRDYDPTTHTREPIGFSIEDDILTIHRGNNVMRLSQLAGTKPVFINNQLVSNMRYHYQMMVAPRNQLQKDAIDFLTLRGMYERGRIYTQYALVLKPGSGKTYCAIAAALRLGVRTIVILHQDKIREQWIKTLREKTNMKMNRVLTITGGDFMDQMITSPPDFDIAFILHSSIISYINTRGKEKAREFFSSLQCGIKIVDEVHLYFKDTIMTDFLTDIPRNFYLTATFTRSDFREARLFKSYFSSTVKFYPKDEGNKNVVYEFILYTSNPSYTEQASIETYWGFSSTKYGDYSFKKDPYKTIIQVYLFALEKALEHTGKVIVMVPKIENCETLYELTKHLYPNKVVGTVHSKNTKEHNEHIKDTADIIISRVGSLGTGSDVALIRSLILMEPYSSPVTAEQMIGRLRPYYDEDSYVYELVNTGFFKVLNMLKRRYATIKRVCKEVRTLRYENE